MNMKRTAIFFTAVAILMFFRISGVEAAQNVDNVEEENDISMQYDEMEHEWVFGEAGIYYELIDYHKDTYEEDGEIIEVNDSNLVIPFFHVNTVTPRYRGFSLGAGLTGYTYEQYSAGSGRTKDDYSKLLVHQLYLEYVISRTRFRIGRMELENSLVLRDYYEAFSISSGELNNGYLIFALVEKVAESDINKFIEFQNVNRGDESIDDYLYAIEASWKTEHDVLATTAYFYHQGNFYSLYGIHLDILSGEGIVCFGVTGDLYATDEDDRNGLKDENDVVRNGDIYHINPFIRAGDLEVGVGYIEAGRAVGAREGGVIDDYFNPFNEGNKVYDPDAKTWYASAEYESEDVEIGLVYGRTEYLEGGRRLQESEIGLKAGFGFMDNFRINSEFSIVNSESPEGNYRLLETVLLYEF